MPWLKYLFSRRRRYDELSETIREHLDEKIADLMDRGMTREQAESAARREFGNVTLIEQRSREVWQWPTLESIWADLKYTFRQLGKSPGFTMTAVVTLALAIGANTATFSMLNAVLLRTLPVRDPQNLVVLRWTSDEWPSDNLNVSGYSDYEFSYPTFQRLQSQHQIFLTLFGFASLGFKEGNVAIKVDGQTSSGTGTMVTDGFFQGLGVASAAGRLFQPLDMLPSAPRVAVISYAYWERQFAGSFAAIGREISLNGHFYTIIGVAAPKFTGLQAGEPDDLWIPVTDDPAIRPWTSDPPPGESLFTSRKMWWLTLVGRLRPGITPKQAEAALGPSLISDVNEVVGSPLPPRMQPHLHVDSGRRGLQNIQESYSKPALILMALVVLVLLAACANLAALLLARAHARSREIAARIALGASRTRIVRQLVTESLFLSVVGGLFGVLIAFAATRVFGMLLSNSIDALSINLTLDRTVLAFTASISILTGALFGLAPAWQSTHIDVNSALKNNPVAAKDSRGHSRFTMNKSLVVTQAAISTFLLIGAGLFLHSLEQLRNQATGFDAKHLLVFRLQPPQSGYTDEQLQSLYADMRVRLAALPGVSSATVLGNRFIDSWISNGPTQVEGYTAPDRKDPLTMRNVVGPHFLEASGIALLAGRDVEESDTKNSPKVAIVNEAFVRQYFGGRNPIGYHIRYKIYTGQFVTFAIVGVCHDALYQSMRNPPKPTSYFSFLQDPEPSDHSAINFLLRTSGNPAALADEVRSTVREIDPNLLVSDLRTQEEQMDDSLVTDRLFAQLSGFFGVLALLLAAIGLYGTLSYSVTLRTREFGIRMALGAQRRLLLRMVLSQGLRLVLYGILAGLVTAALSRRVIASMLFGIQPWDWASFAGAGLLLVAVALFAAYLPARRAASIEPMQALRTE
jgi:predicted permease